MPSSVTKRRKSSKATKRRKLSEDFGRDYQPPEKRLQSHQDCNDVHSNDHQTSPSVSDFNDSTFSRRAIHANDTTTRSVRKRKWCQRIINLRKRKWCQRIINLKIGIGNWYQWIFNVFWRGRQTPVQGAAKRKVKGALNDVYILSDDKDWSDALLDTLKEKRPLWKFSSDKEWIGGRRKVRHLFISTERSKKVVIGFTEKSENDTAIYATVQVIDDMLKRKKLDDSRLIPVKLSEDAEIPSLCDSFTIANAWKEDFITLLLEAIDNCANIDAPCQVNLKEMIYKGLEKKGVGEDLLEEFSKEWSIDFIVDNESVAVDSNESDFDCYIVSGDNEWEENVYAELKNRNKNLKVICRKKLISDISTGKNRKKTMDSGGSVFGTLLEPVLKTKKIIVGFESKDNGYLNYIAGAVVDRQCEQGDHFGGLIPVMISPDAVIPFIAKQFLALKAFDDDFYEHLLKALDEISVRVKVSSTNKNLEIQKVLDDHVEEFQDHHNLLHIKIRKYFSEIGLKFNGITSGSIVLHLSAHDSGALRHLSDFDVQKNIMKTLAQFLLPEHLQKEFLQDWSMLIEEYDADLKELETHLRLKDVMTQITNPNAQFNKVRLKDVMTQITNPNAQFNKGKIGTWYQRISNVIWRGPQTHDHSATKGKEMELRQSHQLHKTGYLRDYVASMLHRKKCFAKQLHEGLSKEKEYEKEHPIKSKSIVSSLSKSIPDMTYWQQSTSHQLKQSRVISTIKPHIIFDICNSLRRLSSHMNSDDEKVITDEHIIQLMRKADYSSWTILSWIETESKEKSSENIGRMIAHVLISVENETALLEVINRACTDDVVNGLSAECQKLNFRYNITEYKPSYSSSSSRSIAVSFLIHLLSNAPKLQTLYLNRCNIKGVTVKDTVDAISREEVVLELRYLKVRNNHLDDIEGHSLATLLVVAPKVDVLDMYNCGLSGVIIVDMAKTCASSGIVLKLTNLTISKNNLNDIKGSSLTTLLDVAPKLRYLYMSKCSLSGVIVDDMVKECSGKGIVLELDYFDISQNNLKDIKGASLATLLAVAPKLNSLNMSKCSLSDVIVDDMAKACSSRKVVLELHNLNISQNNLNNVEGSSITTLLTVAPKLNYLYMGKCNLSGVILDDMVKNCSRKGVVLELDNFDISRNNLKDIKGSSLATLLAVAPKLNTLNISHCSLSGVIVDDIVKECSGRGVVLELTDLTISQNNLEDVKGSSLTTLLNVAPKLRYLNMCNCSLTGIIVDDMVKECSSRGVVLQLNELYISQNNLKDINGASLATLLDIAPQLIHLKMHNCSLPNVIVGNIIEEYSSRGFDRSSFIGAYCS